MAAVCKSGKWPPGWKLSLIFLLDYSVSFNIADLLQLTGERYVRILFYFTLLFYVYYYYVNCSDRNSGLQITNHSNECVFFAFCNENAR